MFELKAISRDTAKQSAGNLRSQEMIPAEVYGHGQDNHHLVLKRLDFEKIFNAAGESNLISLIIDEKKSVNVLVKDVQLNPVSDQVMHVDFYLVKMGEKLTTEIPLEFVGVAKAVKELGGFLVKSLSSLPVSCLPKDLVAKIEVDISPLVDFDKVIDVKDLSIPDGIEIMLDGSVPVCLVQEPRIEKEEKPAEAESETAAEGEDKESKEGEEKDEKDSASGKDTKKE